jgi:hypothetical protein
VEDHYRLNIILICNDHLSEMHPTDSILIHAGDTLAVLGGPDSLNDLLVENGCVSCDKKLWNREETKGAK